MPAMPAELLDEFTVHLSTRQILARGVSQLRLNQLCPCGYLHREGLLPRPLPDKPLAAVYRVLAVEQNGSLLNLYFVRATNEPYDDAQRDQCDADELLYAGAIAGRRSLQAADSPLVNDNVWHVSKSEVRRLRLKAEALLREGRAAIQLPVPVTPTSAILPQSEQSPPPAPPQEPARQVIREIYQVPRRRILR